MRNSLIYLYLLLWDLCMNGIIVYVFFGGSLIPVFQSLIFSLCLTLLTFNYFPFIFGGYKSEPQTPFYRKLSRVPYMGPCCSKPILHRSISPFSFCSSHLSAECWVLESYWCRSISRKHWICFFWSLTSADIQQLCWTFFKHLEANKRFFFSEICFASISDNMSHFPALPPHFLSHRQALSGKKKKYPCTFNFALVSASQSA